MGFPKIAKGSLTGEKSKRPRPGVPLNKKTLLELIKKYKGNITRVADAIGSNRHCIRYRCDQDPELDQALIDARERFIDELEESVWDRAVESKDTTLQLFLLKTQAKHRGYEQDDAKHAAKEIATAAFNYIVNKQDKQQ